MATIVAAVVLVGLAMLALGVGLMFGRPAVKGSCGGIACGGACEACPEREAKP